jgi:chromosome partitioning protein
MSRTIAIANQKGGVGKSTTAINLSACLAVAEKRVLVIDFDPQANTTSGMGYDSRSLERSVYDAIIGSATLSDVINSTEIEFLKLAPSSIDLVGAEVELVDQENRESRLRTVLSAESDSYDYVFIDCPPSLGLLTLNALVAAQSILIPIQCEFYALEGLGQLLRTIELVRSNLNRQLSIEGILLTMYDSRLNLSRQVADEARRHFDGQVFNTVIHRNVRLSEAPSFGKPIVFYDAVSTGAKNYLQLAEEFLNHD